MERSGSIVDDGNQVGELRCGKSAVESRTISLGVTLSFIVAQVFYLPIRDTPFAKGIPSHHSHDQTHLTVAP